MSRYGRFPCINLNNMGRISLNQFTAVCEVLQNTLSRDIHSNEVWKYCAGLSFGYHKATNSLPFFIKPRVLPINMAEMRSAWPSGLIAAPLSAKWMHNVTNQSISHWAESDRCCYLVSSSVQHLDDDRTLSICGLPRPIWRLPGSSSMPRLVFYRNMITR